MSESAVAEKPTIQSFKRGPKRASELDSRRLQVDPKRTLTLPGVNESLDEFREESTIVATDPSLQMKERQALEAFLNDPVKILIHRSNEKNFAPKCTDLVAVNGVKAEILSEKGWISVGYLPRGKAIVVKRYVVERLAAARLEGFQTEVMQHNPNEDPINNINSNNTYTLPFSVLEDRNQPKGAEWLEKLMQSQA